MDFNFPDVEKATSKLTIGYVNFADGEKYVTVAYKKDDATDDDRSGWPLWGDAGVFDTSPQDTKSSVSSRTVISTSSRDRISWTYESHSHATRTGT